MCKTKWKALILEGLSASLKVMKPIGNVLGQACLFVGEFPWRRIVQKVLSQLFSFLLVTVVKLFFYFVDTKNFSSFIRRKEKTCLLFLSLSWASQVYSMMHTFL